jgi:hypothetical protein
MSFIAASCYECTTCKSMFRDTDRPITCKLCGGCAKCCSCTEFNEVASPRDEQVHRCMLCNNMVANLAGEWRCVVHKGLSMADEMPCKDWKSIEVSDDSN